MTRAGMRLLEGIECPDRPHRRVAPSVQEIAAIEDEARAAALREVAEKVAAVLIGRAKPPVTHDFCRWCKARNQLAGEPIDHWQDCPLAILTEATGASEP